MDNDFISTVSHELRTPLTALIGSIKIVNTLFKGNKSGINGGAIGTRLGKDGNNKDAKIDISATFEGNEALQNGGAIYNKGTANITNFL